MRTFYRQRKTLHLTTVDIGADVPSNIVCGAANVAAGQKVVVATVEHDSSDWRGAFYHCEAQSVWPPFRRNDLC